jgi:hypothetical protein
MTTACLLGIPKQEADKAHGLVFSTLNLTLSSTMLLSILCGTLLSHLQLLRLLQSSNVTLVVAVLNTLMANAFRAPGRLAVSLSSRKTLIDDVRIGV